MKLWGISLPQKVLMLQWDQHGWFHYDGILHSFRDSLIPSGSLVHYNPLNLQLTRQATLICSQTWMELLKLGVRHYSLIYAAIYRIGYTLNLGHISICCRFLVHLQYDPGPSLRMCSDEAQLCRVNVNVLTRLSKIRAAPAPVGPLN